MNDDQKPSKFIINVMSVMLLNQDIRDEKKRMSSHEFIEHVIDTVPAFYKLAVVNEHENKGESTELADLQKVMTAL